MNYEENFKSVYVLNVPFSKTNSFTNDFKDFSVINISTQTSVKKQRKARTIGSKLPSRYICVLLGFMSFFLLTTQRLNLGMGIVAMVNRTALLGLRSLEHDNSTHIECPHLYLDTATEEVRPRMNEGHLLWSTETQNHIMGVSFFGTVLTQIPSGRMAEVIGAKQVLMGSLVLASLCNMVSPLVSEWGALAFMGVQFVKGLAQGMVHPAVCCLMSKWFPTPEKGFLSSLAFSGYPLGAVVGGLATGTMCDSHFFGGWPMGFYVFGFLGLVVAILVQNFSFNCPDDDHGISEAEYKYIVSNIESRSDNSQPKTPWCSMASSPATWALLVGMFGQYWIAFYFMSVHPTYLGSVLHFTNTENGYLNSLPYIGQMLVTSASSYVSDVLVNKGVASTDVLRKVCNSLSCLGFSISFLLLVYAGCDKTLNILLFVIAMSAAGFGYPGSNTVAMDMTINFAGTLIGIASTFASCSGFIIPLVVGSLTSEKQSLAQWAKVFYISSGISLVSGVVFTVFGSAKLQDWDNIILNQKNPEGLDNKCFEKAEEDSNIEKKTLDCLSHNWTIIERL
ncbi:hypothetical protein JTE90_023398 [Oedothorax gibbosus]|uniref:Major facilitator superfamily (MFS) profile domain-containing protein n=1 Tax=Oedothorax gibbosus TaxID=931172 RepID=A0AAV6UED9_9ARAC|nr:hypothetical protein JTE90_023398 [Oedothorax gibbosus]